MKSHVCVAAFLLGMMITPIGRAQAPAGAPAGANGQCNDGTYSTAASKKGACRGHKGVKTWWAPSAPASAPAAAAPAAAPAPAPKAAPAPAPTPAVTSAPAAAPSKTSKATAPASAPAPGGGPGLVWVNSGSNVYHCYGSRYYGTTKSGKYLTEAQAKAAGARPDHGKACGQ